MAEPLDKQERRRSRLWWYRRMRRAYKKHGVTIKNRRETLADACFARRAMKASEQWKLEPIRGEREA